MKTRRMFLRGEPFAGEVTGLPVGQPQEFPRKPQPIELPPPEFPNSPEKRMPEDNNKDARKNVERLYQLAAELKAEVDKTDSTKVLALDFLKKVEEIEKLAHEVRKRSKG